VHLQSFRLEFPFQTLVRGQGLGVVGAMVRLPVAVASELVLPLAGEWGAPEWSVEWVESGRQVEDL